MLDTNESSTTIEILLSPLDTVLNKNYIEVKLILIIGNDYPKEVPQIILKDAKNLTSKQLLELEDLLKEKSREIVGEVMIYILTDTATEFIQRYNTPAQSLREKMMQREAMELNRINNDGESSDTDEEMEKKFVKKRSKQKKKNFIFMNNSDSDDDSLFSEEEEESEEEEDESNTKSEIKSEKWIMREVVVKSMEGDVCQGSFSEVDKQILRKCYHFNQYPNYKVEMENHLNKIKNFKCDNLVKLLGFNWDEKDCQSGVNLIMFFENMHRSLESIILSLGRIEDMATLKKHIKQILEGINFLHKNKIVHNNINSSTILADNGIYKIADYGLNNYKKSLSCYQNTKNIWKNSEEHDDIFNLGVITLELFEGEILKQFRSPQETSKLMIPIIPDEVPYDLREFLELCLKRNRQTKAQSLLISDCLDISSTKLDFIFSPLSNMGINSRSRMDNSFTDTNSISNQSDGMNNIFGSAAQINSRYKEDFVELKNIGSGGQGSVFKVRNKLDSSMYAIKKVRLYSNSKSNEKVLREVITLSRLHHQYVVRYFQAWVESTNEIEENMDHTTTEQENIHENNFSTSGEGSDEDQSSDEDIFARSQIGRDNSLSNTISSIHSHTVGERSFVTKNQMLYIQMEFCTDTLKRVIDTGCEEEEYWKLFRQIVEGLEYIHSLGNFN